MLCRDKRQITKLSSITTSNLSYIHHFIGEMESVLIFPAPNRMSGTVHVPVCTSDIRAHEVQK